MLFIEPRFLLFFIIVFAVHWGLRAQTLRKVWLLATSYMFYGAWDWRFLSLILISTVLDYSVGLLLSWCLSARSRMLCLALSVVGNLGLLGFFKYFNFFIRSAGDLAHLLGLSWNLETLSIILPVGISFYTFQTLSYVIDVYRGRLPATRRFVDFALFVAFFPQLVAGPIVRAADYLPQLLTPRVFARVEVRSCLTLFLIGFIKKACISDNLAPVVDAYFAAPQDYSALSAWLAVVFYAVQIYCDFSGYSDMALGSAGLLGYRLCMNFNFPYLAGNITEFWRRWHISLSTWLRDYLYIPLGGSRGSKLFTYRNLMLTMLLGGLWHGASWNFVVWGGLQGLALIVHKEWVRRTSARASPPPLSRLGGVLLTFYWVCVTWVFFRSADLTTAAVVLKALVLFHAEGARTVGLDLAWLVPVLLLAHVAAYQGFWREWVRKVAGWAFAGGYSLTGSLAIAVVPSNYHPFIYFQF